MTLNAIVDELFRAARARGARENREAYLADAVVEMARRARGACKAYNEVWLLDGDGAYVGCWTSRSVVRVRDLALDPSNLLAATRLALAEVAHPHWLVFENREGSGGNPRPTEADVQAFLRLREALGAEATVIDAVILGERQLWSLHDLIAPGKPYALRSSAT